MQGKDMEEINEMFDQISSILDKMKHMMGSKTRCAMCGEPSTGICPACSFDPRS